MFQKLKKKELKLNLLKHNFGIEKMLMTPGAKSTLLTHPLVVPSSVINNILQQDTLLVHHITHHQKGLLSCALGLHGEPCLVIDKNSFNELTKINDIITENMTLSLKKTNCSVIIFNNLLSFNSGVTGQTRLYVLNNFGFESVIRSGIVPFNIIALPVTPKLSSSSVESFLSLIKDDVVPNSTRYPCGAEVSEGFRTEIYKRSHNFLHVLNNYKDLKGEFKPQMISGLPVRYSLSEFNFDIFNEIQNNNVSSKKAETYKQYTTVFNNLIKSGEISKSVMDILSKPVHYAVDGVTRVINKATIK